MPTSVVDTREAVLHLLDRIGNLLLINKEAALAIDLEGAPLGRSGRSILLTIFPHPDTSNVVYIVDLLTLGDAAFTTPTDAGVTLKHILDDRHIRKLLFDCRKDSRSLFFHHHIKLDGVEDIQLMEHASRANLESRFVNCLSRCAEMVLTPTEEEKKNWSLGKELAEADYESLLVRPILQKTKNYCAQDVLFLPVMREAFKRRLRANRSEALGAWEANIRDETDWRLSESRTESGGVPSDPYTPFAYTYAPVWNLPVETMALLKASHVLVYNRETRKVELWERKKRMVYLKAREVTKAFVAPGSATYDVEWPTLS